MIVAEIVGLAALALAAYIAGCRKIPTKTPRHEHVWGEWQQSQINTVSPTGVFLYKRGIQERNCLGCNFYEREYT